MKESDAPNNAGANRPAVSDSELLYLFQTNPQQGWALFIDRYADKIFSRLCGLGFDYDQAMDRFVYVCRKLCEEDFRRLKSIQYAGNHGDLTPWVRKVVERLSINWTWSEEGRRRILKSIARLPPREQRVFELYFWKGLSPSEIYEELQVNERSSMEFTDVFDCLDNIFSHLSRKKLWRLISNLARKHGPVSLDEIDEETGTGIEPRDVGANPEEMLIQKDSEERVNGALARLSPRERLIIQFRYEEAMAFREIGEVLHLEEWTVKSALRTALHKLRQALK